MQLIRKMKKLNENSSKEELFTYLVNNHANKMFKVIYLIVNNKEEAEDIVQESYIKAWQKWENFRGECSNEVFIHRIGVNLAIDKIRRKKKLSILIPKLFEQKTINPEDIVLKNEEEKQLHKAIRKFISKLNKQERCILILKYYGNFKISEISEILSIPTGTIKTKLFHSRKKIQNQIENDKLLLDSYLYR